MRFCFRYVSRIARSVRCKLYSEVNMKNRKQAKKAKKVKRPLLAEGGQSEKEVWDALKDPNGSWTGVPDNPLDLPEQDVDDL